MSILNTNEDETGEPTVAVHFGVTSLTKKLTDLSSQLGVPASHSFQLGDEVVTRTGIHKRGRSVWQLRSAGNVDSSNLDDHLAWILNKIEPFRHTIQQYLDDPEVEVHIRINCRCPDAIGGVSIQSATMQRLTMLSERIDIGFIGDALSGENKGVRNLNN